MRPTLLTRLKRLEDVRTAERRHRLEVQFGYFKELPREYAGERHVVTVGRLPDDKYQWEERPGPAPGKEDDSSILRVIFVKAKPIESDGGQQSAAFNHDEGH